MSDAIALERPRRLVLADLIPGALLRDVALVVAAAGFVGLLAQISIPHNPVPFTGQTLGVLLAGTALGWKRGTAAMVLYGAAGIVGVPWFADHAHGYVGASFGYIIGFVFCAALCGYLAERGADRSILKCVPAMVAGELVMYVIGVTWLKVDTGQGWSWSIFWGFTVFIPGDAIKAAFAAGLLPAAWKLAGRSV